MENVPDLLVTKGEDVGVLDLNHFFVMMLIIITEFINNWLEIKLY